MPEIKIGRSTRLALLLIVMHILCATLLCATALPVVITAALLVLVLISLAYYLARDAWCLTPQSWMALSFEQDKVVFRIQSGDRFAGEIEKTSVITPWCVLLRIKLADRFFPVSRLILPDALDHRVFRELCIRLGFS